MLVSCKSKGGGFAAAVALLAGGGGAASTAAELVTAQHTKAHRRSAPPLRMARD